ncbi:hypothetical protein GCM10009760_60580 [Kitasatospora kazusensis]|uniref:Uncharacterized protein n=1 Tax=Kitasatospora kazusensis TaxID=407974 RepID=A0ABN3ABF5_9ACTN
MQAPYGLRQVGAERGPVGDRSWAGHLAVDPAVHRPGEREGGPRGAGVHRFRDAAGEMRRQPWQPVLLLPYGRSVVRGARQPYEQLVAEPVHGVVRARAGR